MNHQTVARLGAVIVSIAATACTVGPRRAIPAVETPAAYKSATAAESRPVAIPTDWWTLFGDDDLTSLEEQALRKNHDLSAAAARVLQARAAARAVDSAFFPLVTADPGITRAHAAPRAGTVSGGTATTIQVPFDVSYEVDLWGRIRQSSTAAHATAESATDAYGVVLWTLTADVAQNLFNLRALDWQDDVLTRTIAAYERLVELTQRKQRTGLSSSVDVLQAETQLDLARTMIIDVRRQRADTEHALAILVGVPPAELSVSRTPLAPAVPTVPAGLPASLLAQRPDVAQAEHDLVAANANVGVAQASLYPSLQLTGSTGLSSPDAAQVVAWSSRAWSIGASLLTPIFEGGRLRAGVAQACARRDELDAAFRQTVLLAFGEVEDSLTDLHARADTAAVLDHAIASSREALRLIESQYAAGVVGYLSVIDAQRTLLSNEITGVQILNQRLVSTALGRIGIITIPRFRSDIYVNAEDLVDLIVEALELAHRIGARTVSFTGLIPSATEYGHAVARRIVGRPDLPMITTGHATTAAAVVLAVRRILEESGRNLTRERIGFLGLGSIGTATLRLLLRCLPHPAEIILCDIYSKMFSLESIKKDLVDGLSFKGLIRTASVTSRVPREFYDASLIVGATNVPEVLDFDLVKGGTLIVDDSAPHCFNTGEAVQRFLTHGDILFCEGGTLKSPDSVTQLRHIDQRSEQKAARFYNELIARFRPNRITGCVLSSLLSARFETAEPTLGLVDDVAALQHYRQLEALGFRAYDLHCDSYLVPQAGIGSFSRRFGRVAVDEEALSQIGTISFAAKAESSPNSD